MQKIPPRAGSAVSLDASGPSNVLRPILQGLLALGAVFVVGILCWQALADHGAPDPTQLHTSPTVAFLNIGVLVFREGLECILVLSAITASMVGPNLSHRRPVIVGAGVGSIATLITWFIAIGVISSLSQSVPALHMQAATGLLAVIVLLVVMNWFFHKVYWGGWICLHNRKKKELIQRARNAEISKRRLLFGLGLLGFATFYREGFEVVLFLQSYRLRLGEQVVVSGAFLGIFLTAIVAVLTFIAHHKLPYRKMLVFTGVMLGLVLLVMVGEQAQEMQLAGWLPATKIGWLDNIVPDWAGVWFSVYPTIETLTAQLLAALLVIGSYFAARVQSQGNAVNASNAVIAAN